MHVAESNRQCGQKLGSTVRKRDQWQGAASYDDGLLPRVHAKKLANTVCKQNQWEQHVIMDMDYCLVCRQRSWQRRYARRTANE